MNSINISKVSQYKGAIIQYMCSECNKGNNFFIEFTGVSSINHIIVTTSILIFYYLQKEK